MSRIALSPETKETIVQWWRGVLLFITVSGLVAMGGTFVLANRTADKVTTIESAMTTSAAEVKAQMTTISVTLDALRTSYMKTDSTLSIGVLRILEEQGRQIGDLRLQDGKKTEEISSLKVQIARLEAELNNFRRSIENQPGGTWSQPGKR